MSTELKRTLDIIQNKLQECNQHKRDITRRMATKSMLLRESEHVLQHDLNNTLLEDTRTKNKINSTITRIDSTKNEVIRTSLAREPIKGIVFSQCQGWVRDRRVWIQVDGVVLSSDITKVQVYCLPNNLITETMHLNKSKETVFTIAFDVLHDTSIAKLKQCLRIACTFQYKGQYHMTETCLIEWLSDQDFSWFTSILSSNVIQTYFPCHIGINSNQKDWISNQLINKYAAFKDNTVYIHPDQTCLIHFNSNQTDIYALNSNYLSRILDRMDPIVVSSANTEKDLIVALGNECVTFNSKTRSCVALETSRFIQ